MSTSSPQPPPSRLDLVVRDVASKTLHAVLPTTSIVEIERLLEERDISAVPVIDASGALVGIVSTTDLLRAAARQTSERPGVIGGPAPPRVAADLMQPDVATIDEGAPLGDAARVMMARHIHRLVVLRETLPVGVVSTRDAMRAVLRLRIETPLAEVMSAPVETVDIADPIRVAVTRLQDANVRGLIVVDGDWPVGVFAQPEAIRARLLPPSLWDRPVEDAMSYATICLDVSTPLYRVAGHAIEMHVRRVLAVEKRQLRGVASGFDLARVLAARP
jgi:CBS domain-containing protein